MQRFQSILQFKKVSCKNCYKCVRNCPVKAIRVHDHQARIIESQCIYCEKCILVCPQDAKEEQNMIPAICNAMENKTQVIASLHPAYLARFGVTGINGIREAMKKLGFADAADAAEGASLMISQYRALFAEQKEPGIMISSACPVIVQLVKKHYPHLLGNLVQSASMMQFHASYLKKKYPKAEIVYVSPCISAMSELRDSGNEVDYVITLEELAQWMKKEGISITEKEPEQIAYRSREIAIADGLTDLLGAVKGIRRLSVSGMEQCREVLEELHPEDFENCFLEMYACSGGCVAGPSFQMKKGHYLADVLAVKNAAFGKDFHREKGRWNKRKNPHQELSKFGMELTFYQKPLSFYWDVCYNNIKILRLQRLAFSMPERIKKRRLKGKRGVFPLPACQRRIPALVLEGVRGFERQ